MGIKRIRAPRQAWAILATSLIVAFPSRRVAGDGMFRLQGHVPIREMRKALYLGENNPSEPMRLAVVLKPRDQAGLDEFLQRVNDPHDPLYHRYLTPAQFAERFGADERDVQAMADHLGHYGLRVAGVHPNRLVLDVEGDSASVEDAFQVRMNRYKLANGRVAVSANADPIFPAALAAKVSAVAGLESFHQRVPHLALPAAQAPAAVPEDFMTPAKIKSAYELGGITQTGAGETLALFELDGYDAADVTAYTNYFHLPAPNLANVLVDGATGAAGDGATEVTLDIELALAIAPDAKIMVYEGPNTDQGVLDTYSKIANDNLAKVVSTSWGYSEDGDTSAFLSGENTIFQQMAAQGQSLFAASGDSGAYDDPSNRSRLSVDDPASQPYVTGVGGTTLVLNGAGNSRSEGAWSDPARGHGGGGGISNIWAQPSWQSVAGQVQSLGSTTKRMVPDVSLDSDPGTGYPIYKAGWRITGGTSCAAPLWAAYATLVNQKLVADGHARLGFVNPALYQIGQSARYGDAFNDVDDGSTNLHFPTTFGYDLATGLGTFRGQGLFDLLTGGALPATIDVPGALGTISVRAN